MLAECSTCTQFKNNRCNIYMLYGFPKSCYLNLINSVPKKLKKLLWNKPKITKIPFILGQDLEVLVQKSRKNGFIYVNIFFNASEKNGEYLKYGAKVYISSEDKVIHSFQMLLNFQEKEESEMFYSIIENIYTGIYDELKRRIK